MKSFILVIAFFFATPTNADVQTMIDNWKRHNEQVMDLKKNPEKYGLAPRGFYEIKSAAIAVILFGAYFKTLHWTTNQPDHYKIVISLMLATALNYAAIGFEKPVKKPSLIDNFIAWVKPVKGSK